MKMFRYIIGVLALGLVVAQTSAYAEIIVDAQAITPPEWEANPKTKDNLAPRFQVVVKHGAPPGLDKKDFVWKQVDGPSVISVKPEKVELYQNSNEPMAMVVLIQGDERWIGNETYFEEDASEDGLAEAALVGAFTGIGPMLDELNKAGPPGSVAALVVYGEKVETKLPISDASKLTAGALGAQRDFQGEAGVSFLPGIDRAITLLTKQTGKRRILVIIGDGTGQAEDLRGPIRKRKETLESLGAEVYTVQLSANPNDPPSGPQNMKTLGYTDAKKANSKDNLKAHAALFVESINQRYYLVFPGVNQEAGVYFVHDGQEHEFELKVGEELVEGVMVQTKLWSVKKGIGLSWWMWLIIALIPILLLILILKRRQPKVEPEPEPEPLPAHTIMLGVGGDQEGFPIVGWVVPLTGPQQYHTYKLLQGKTVFGTGGESHVIVEDQFMSTEHAEIVCTPSGFTLNDGGSTNGSMVNEKPIQSHELVDNDVFTLGRTGFKFKSIN